MQIKRTGNELHRQDSQRNRSIRAGLVLLVAVLISTFLDRSDIKGFGFDYFERFPRKVQLGVAMRRHADLIDWVRQQIVLVPISESTFEAGTGIEAPPVPRHYHAKVIDDLTRAGAKAIAFDLVFDLESTERNDDSLAAAARRSGRVIWASILPETQGGTQEAILPIPQFLNASPYHGHIRVPQLMSGSKSERPDVESIEPVVYYSEHQPVASFGVAAALLKLGIAGQPLRQIGDAWKIEDITIPVDAEGFSRIRYLGSSSEESGADLFPRVPYETLYNGAVDQEFYRKSQFFRDKIIIIGDVTTVGNDFRTTPVGYMWGPEIHAHVAANILLAKHQDFPLVREASPFTNFCVLMALSALVGLLAARWRLQWTALAATLLLIGYYAFNLWLFADYGVELHIIAPTASVILVMLGMLTERGLTEEHEKRRMRQLLQRYVSESIADYVTAHPEKCYLGGDRVTATVLFSDIRGFTSLAEKLEPEEVLNLLNEYMEAMTEVVYRYDGTVDKFVGDGIMALFGVPAPCENHAWQAVATAIDMQNELLKFHKIWTARGLPLFDIGIGINSGEMIFGNIGSSKRMDFSVIGDAVNLASRLEALNKEWGTRILITEATYKAVKDQIHARGPLSTAIRGKEEAVNVYEVVDWRVTDEPENLLNTCAKPDRQVPLSYSSRK